MPVQGLLGRKIGMTQVFLEDGECVGVTAIEAGPCVVVQVKTPETDGYRAVQLGFEEVSERAKNRPALGHFRSKGVGPHRYVREVGWDGSGDLKPGDRVGVEVFENVPFVDVTGWTKGRGFAGVVKRWDFGGGPATHGQTDRERSPGSLGRQGSNPGDVKPGKRMAGRYGNERVTVRNLEVVRILKDRNTILVRGAVPGPSGRLVIVRPSPKRKATRPPPQPRKQQAAKAPKK